MTSIVSRKRYDRLYGEDSDTIWIGVVRHSDASPRGESQQLIMVRHSRSQEENFKQKQAKAAKAFAVIPGHSRLRLRLATFAAFATFCSTLLRSES